MAKDDTSKTIMIILIVIVVCCSSLSSLSVIANENPSFGGSALDFLRGEWYSNIFGGGGGGGDDGGGDGGDDGGGGGDDEEDDEEEDNDKKGDKDKKFKNNCAYLYEDKDGKKYLMSKCTDGEKTYKGSKLDGMSSIRVGKDLTVFLYDKNDKKKTFKGKKDKIYNLSGNWNKDTRKMMIQHKDYKKDVNNSSHKSNNTQKNNTSEHTCEYLIRPSNAIDIPNDEWRKNKCDNDKTWKKIPNICDANCDGLDDRKRRVCLNNSLLCDMMISSF
jgi:hypothetical protein